MSAFGYSLAGFRAAWRHEHAFRQELVVVVPSAVLAMFVPVTPLHRLLLIAVLVMVLIIELLNSAIEAVVDRVSTDRHPLSKFAKDLGSAAVFLAVCLALATWAVVLYPVLFR